MNTIPFVLPILALVTIWILAWRIGTVGAGWRIAASLMPAVLVYFVIEQADGNGHFDDLRFQIESFEFNLEKSGNITIGGGTTDANSDTLIIPGMPPHFLSIGKNGDVVEMKVGFGDGILGIRRDREIDLVGVIPLAEDSVVCVGNCQSPLTMADWRDRAQKDVTKKETDTGEDYTGMDPFEKCLIPQLSCKPPGWERIIFPVAHYGQRNDLSSFAFRNGRRNESQLYLALRDPNVFVENNGQRLPLPDTVVPLAQGETKVVLLQPTIRSDALDKRVNKLQRRRGFTLTLDGSKLTVVPETLPYVQFEQSQLIDAAVTSKRLLTNETCANTRAVPGFGKNPELGRRPISLTLRSLEVGSDKSALEFSLITKAAWASDLNADILIDPCSRQAARASDVFLVETPSNLTSHSYGATVRLADTDGRALLLRVLRLEKPQFLAGFLLFVSLMALSGTWYARTSKISWLVLTATEMLLAIRILMAISGAHVDPASEGTLRGSLIAYIVLPFVLAILPLPEPDDRSRRLALTGYGMAALILIGITSYAHPPLERAEQIGGAICMAALAAIHMPLLRRWGGRFGRLLKRSPSARRRMFSEDNLAWVLIAIALLLALSRAGAFALFNAREAVNIGPRLSLSVIYTPIVIILAALLFDAVRKASRHLDPRWWLGGWLVLAVLFIVPISVRDHGYVIYILPFAMFAMFMHFEHAAEPRWKLSTLAVFLAAFILIWVGLKAYAHWLQAHDVTYLYAWAAVIVVVILLIGLACVLSGARTTWMRHVGSAAWAVPGFLIISLMLGLHLQPGRDPGRDVSSQQQQLSDEQRLDELKAFLRLDQNHLRIWTLLQPETITRAGTIEAEQLSQNIAYVRSYALSEPTGFLGIQSPRFLPLVHMTDNVSAVHLMAPFGRVGAVSLLLLVGTLAILASWRWAERRHEGTGWRSIAGVLALWTIFGVDAYMILGNLGIVPFTGKNVFFLTATSGSDLAEAGVLMALAKWGLNR